MRVVPTAAEVAAQESRDGGAEGEVLSEGEFTLKFSILTFGDIQNRSTLRSPAQALPFQGADLDLSHVAGPPPATSPSTLLLPVPPLPRRAVPAHGSRSSSLWTQRCLRRPHASPTPRSAPLCSGSRGKPFTGSSLEHVLGPSERRGRRAARVQGKGHGLLFGDTTGQVP